MCFCPVENILVFLKFTENIFFIFLVRLKKNNKFETRLTKHDFLNHEKIINDVSNTSELFIYLLFIFISKKFMFKNRYIDIPVVSIHVDTY